MKTSIELFSEKVDFRYENKSPLQDWILDILSKEKHTAHYINIIFCDDDYLLQVNQEYLDHDFFTDIITFQYEQEPIEGELFISIDRVVENAKERNLSFGNELHRVIAHGVLHLMGYGDKSEDEISTMRAKEEEHLSTGEHLFDQDSA